MLPLKSLTSLSPYTLNLLTSSSPSPPNLPAIPTLAELRTRANELADLALPNGLQNPLINNNNNNGSREKGNLSGPIRISRSQGNNPPPSYSPLKEDTNQPYPSQIRDNKIPSDSTMTSTQPGWFTQTPPPRYTPNAPLRKLQKQKKGWFSLNFGRNSNTSSRCDSGGVGINGLLPDESEAVPRKGQRQSAFGEYVDLDLQPTIGAAETIEKEGDRTIIPALPRRSRGGCYGWMLR